MAGAICAICRHDRHFDPRNESFWGGVLKATLADPEMIPTDPDFFAQEIFGVTPGVNRNHFCVPKLESVENFPNFHLVHLDILPWDVAMDPSCGKCKIFFGVRPAWFALPCLARANAFTPLAGNACGVDG